MDKHRFYLGNCRIMFNEGLPFQGLQTSNNGGSQKYYLDGLPLPFVAMAAAGGGKAVFML